MSTNHTSHRNHRNHRNHGNHGNHGLIYYSLLAALLVASPSAKAEDGTQGYEGIFKDFWGSEAARLQAKRCLAERSDDGILGKLNHFLCHLEKDAGIQGPGSTTKAWQRWDIPDAWIWAHAEVTGSEGGGTISAGGASYDFLANVWTCTAGCTSPTNYARTMSLAFSYNPDGSTNRGYLIADYGALTGQPGNSGVIVSYDVGTSTSTRILMSQFVNEFGPFNEKGRIDSSNTGELLSDTVLWVNGDGATPSNSIRFATGINTSTNVVGVFFEGPHASGPGTEDLLSEPQDLTDIWSTPSPACFSREANGDDWTYSPTPQTCFIPHWPSQSLVDVGNYSSASLLGNWNDMPENPTSL